MTRLQWPVVNSMPLDVEWNYHRYFGMGEFKEAGPSAADGWYHLWYGDRIGNGHRPMDG